MGLRHTKRENQSLQTSEDAAAWLQRLRAEDTPQVRAEFSAWVRQGSKNLEEFLFAQAIWKEMDQITPEMRERLENFAAPVAVVEFPQLHPNSPPVTGRGNWRKAMAVAVLVCVAAGGHWFMTRNVYVTDVGEQMSVKLSDGSMIHLNTDSRVAVDYTGQARAIRLESGEALFSVGKDSRRPFEVFTANARIRALGTQFNVRASGAATRVAVVDGAVQVSAVQVSSERAGTLAPAARSSANGSVETIQLRAGDEARVEPKRIVKTPKPNIERAVSWRTRRLMFPGDPVGEIAEEFNRYNKTTIRIEGPQLQMRRMSGVFDADDPSPLLRFLERDPEIEIVHDGDEIVIRGCDESRCRR